MEMHQVRYVLALRESANFTRAAEACGVTQPSLTRAIRRLEEELGGSLFHRVRGHARPTELGAMMLPHLEEIAAQAATAKDQAARLTRGARKTLRLGVMCTIAPEPLLALVTTMFVKHPGIDLKVTDFDSTQLEDLMLENKIDIAILSSRNEQKQQFHYHPLFKEQMLIVLHPENPMAGKDKIDVEALIDGSYINRIHCEFFGKPSLNPAMSRWHVAHSSDRDDWILAMIAAGMGYGFLPANCINHPGVISRPLANEEYWRDVSIVTMRGRRHSAAVGALVREAVNTKWDLFSREKKPRPLRPLQRS